MSTGLVICTGCRREAHQDGPRDVARGWRHCEDRTPLCDGATVTYPARRADIVGRYCAADGRPPYA